MFDQVDGRNELGAFLIQTVSVYLVGFALVLAVGTIVFPGPEAPIKEAAQYGVVAILIVLLALGVHRVAPGSAVAGRWIWIFPMLLEVLCAASWAKQGLFRELFYTGPGQGDSGLGIVFVTYPTWACCWYAVAMWWARRSMKSCNLPSTRT